MRIALVTSLEKPDGTYDDQLLRHAMLDAGHAAEFKVWHGPIDWTIYDVCLIRSTWDYHKKLSRYLTWAEGVTLSSRLVNPLETVKWNVDKSYLCTLGNNGANVVPTKIFSAASEAETAITKMLDANQRVVIKPTVSATAELTFKIESERDVDVHVRAVLERSPLALQPYIDSIETEGEVSLTFFRIGSETRYSHAVLKLARKGEFRVQEEFGGTSERCVPPEEVLTVALKALALIPHKWHYARVDIVDWSTQPKVGELELIEPELFFRLEDRAADLMIQSLT